MFFMAFAVKPEKTSPRPFHRRGRRGRGGEHQIKEVSRAICREINAVLKAGDSGDGQAQRCPILSGACRSVTRCLPIEILAPYGASGRRHRSVIVIRDIGVRDRISRLFAGQGDPVGEEKLPLTGDQRGLASAQ